MMSLAPRSASVRLARPAGKTVAPVLRVVKARATTKDAAKASKGADFDTEAISKQLTETATTLVNDLSAKWEATEEKPAAIAVTVAAFFGVYLASGVMSAVDRLPLFSSLFELIGIGASAWFTYRYLIYGPDREELLAKVNGFFKSVAGK